MFNIAHHSVVEIAYFRLFIGLMISRQRICLSFVSLNVLFVV